MEIQMDKLQAWVLISRLINTPSIRIDAEETDDYGVRLLARACEVLEEGLNPFVNKDEAKYAEDLLDLYSQQSDEWKEETKEMLSFTEAHSART